jgi:hypothetical protein
VLEPRHVLPAEATHLDAQPDLWDGEARLRLAQLVLTPQDLAGLRARHGADPGSVRAGLLAATAERGGLPDVLADAVLVGVLDAAGPAWPQPVRPGAVVATAAPAVSLPCWLADASAWDGRTTTVACRGHAVLHAGSPVVAMETEVEAATIAALARHVSVPALVSDVAQPGDRVAVLGATTVAGALATATAARGGAGRLTGLVVSLQEARLARALGVTAPVVADVAEPSEAAAALAQALHGPADVVVVAVDDPRAVRVGTLLAGDGTLLLAVGRRHADLAARTAAAVGTSPSIRADRPLTPDAGAGTVALVTSSPTLTEVIRWRAGTGPQPAATRPEDA